MINMDMKKVSDECENYVYNITESIYVQVLAEREKACVNAIYAWAKQNGADEVILMDEAKLKEIIRLGAIEYNKLYGD